MMSMMSMITRRCGRRPETLGIVGLLGVRLCQSAHRELPAPYCRPHAVDLDLLPCMFPWCVLGKMTHSWRVACTGTALFSIPYFCPPAGGGSTQHTPGGRVWHHTLDTPRNPCLYLILFHVLFVVPSPSLHHRSARFVVCSQADHTEVILGARTSVCASIQQHG